MHLDVGEMKLTLHIHVPAVSVQSHVPSGDLSHCTGHAAAVSSQRSSVGKNDGISGLLSHDSCAPMIFCGLLLGLVESQFLDESQMQWSSADLDTEPCSSWTSNDKYCPDYLNSGRSSQTPSARRERVLARNL